MTKDKNAGWVTAADVARRAGVSRSAVSRTFTEGASVAPETRVKVLKAAEALGYQVNMLARSVIQQQSNLVGVVVAGFDNPFLMSLLGPLTHYLALRGLAPMLMDASEPEALAKTLRRLLQYRVAGAILTSGAPPIELAEEYLRLRIPVTMINREADLEGVDVINSDNRGGGALAARALLDSGARKLLFLNVASATYSARERSEGFSRAVASHVRRGEVSLRRSVATGSGYAGGFETARKLFAQSDDRPDGVFCVNDALACGLIDGARQLFGLRVPQDLRVVGFDDIPMSSHAAYALTTVRQDVDSLARHAVTSLAERMAEPTMPTRSQQVPVSVMNRQSTGANSKAASVSVTKAANVTPVAVRGR
ncbi:MAG TPA: LacI family DNA-binding transcriptional regulator [Burkholderiaceae bacterium]|nr:LacI family DNA-binding transcriptional regulator [Burkholderiaceae bacterium]